MNVKDLREAIEGIPDETEVRLMNQPSWPFEYSVLGTWSPAPEPDACGDCGQRQDHPVHADYGEDWGPSGEDAPAAAIRALEGTGIHPLDVHAFEKYGDFTPDGDGPVIYLVEGTQLGYGTKAAWEEVERWT